MKKIKGILSIILAAVMVFGCTSVFASAAYPDKLLTIWDDVYYYDGEITVGEKTVTANGSESGDYFVFNVENEGYYSFNFDEEGSVYGIYLLEEYYTSRYEENWGAMYDDGVNLIYLESGENYIGVWFRSEKENSENITVDYLGSEITDIIFDAGTEYPLILGSDISDDDYPYIRICDFSLLFDTDITLEFNDINAYFDYYSAESIKIGENEIEIIIDGESFPKSLTVASVTDYIEKVEVTGGGITETVYYDGSTMGTGRFEFKITYTDGTVINVYEYDEISLEDDIPNKCTVYCGYYNGEGSVSIAGQKFLDFTYEAEKATFAENLEVFFMNIGNQFGYISRIPAYAEDIFTQDSTADSLRAFGEFVSFVNNQFMYAIGDIFEHILMFVQSF